MPALAVLVGLAVLAGTDLDQSRASTGPRPELRIVGGEEAPIGRQPWMVALADKRSSGRREAVFCGGVLVRPDWVVTAGHCIWGMTRGRIEVFTGDGRLGKGHVKGTGVRAIRRPRVPDLDLALLELGARSGKTPLRPSGQVPAAGSVTTAFGWGSLGNGVSSTTRLRRVDLEVRSASRCRSVYFGAFEPSTMLCAGGSGRDTCSGDSGGPLVSKGRLVGITSFGQGCGRVPGIYARVDTVADWLARVVRQERLRRRARR